VRVVREANRVCEWVRVADFFVEPPQKTPGEMVHLVDNAFSLFFFDKMSRFRFRQLLGRATPAYSR